MSNGKQNNINYVPKSTGRGQVGDPNNTKNDKDNSFELDKKRDKAALNISKGVLTYYETPYVLGQEGKKALTEHFKTLNVAGKLKLSNYKEHPHPIGALVRAYMNDLVLYKYAPNDKIKDIGASLVRNLNRFDNDGNCITKRVWSMAPIVSGRDILRKRKHDLNVENSCAHIGGTPRTRKCDCDATYSSTLSVDSIYYPGVLEEMVYDSFKSQGMGYVAFNDYDMALRDHGNVGEACDQESFYVIDKDRVTSVVKGNVAPYNHKFLKTEGQAWQYKMNVEDKEVFVVFEELDCFHNKHIPYRLCSVTAIDANELVKLGEEGGVAGIPLLDIWGREEEKEIVLTKTYSDSATNTDSTGESVTIPHSRMILDIEPRITPLEIYILFWLLMLSILYQIPFYVYKKFKTEIDDVPSSFEKFDVSGPSTTLFYEKEGLRIKEFVHKVPKKPEEVAVDYVHRIETNTNLMTTFWELVRSAGANEQIFTSIDNCELYVNLVLSNATTLSFLGKLYYGFCWLMSILLWFTKPELPTIQYKAKLEHVIRAYEKIGVRTKATSITYSCVSLQKELGDELGVEMLTLHEAFIIATVIRAQQRKRLNTALGLSCSVQEE